MRRILFGGVFALVIGTLLIGDARAQLQNYNMDCVRVQTGGGDLFPQTFPNNWAALDGATVGWNSRVDASTPGTGLLTGGGPTNWNAVLANGGGNITANDGTWLASSRTQTQANCEVPIGANIFVPVVHNLVQVNLAASGPDFATLCTNAWQDDSSTYTGYLLDDPSAAGSKGTLLGTIYLESLGNPADGNVNGDVMLTATIQNSEVVAASMGPAGWWLTGSYRQDTAGNRTGSVPDVIRPPVVLDNVLPPTFQLMLFPTEIVNEGQTVLIYGAVVESDPSAPTSPVSGGGVNYIVSFRADAWFEIEIDPN